MGTRSSLGCLAGVVTILLMGRAFAQGPGGPPAGFGALSGDRPILKQFDGDGNGRLNQAERTAAREWLAAQPWCDGTVGMIDISSSAKTYPGAPAQPPPHPKAIFPVPLTAHL